MNTKRQTIWLVSMLSLMVVLSAYYLFSEDLDPQGAGTETAQTDGAATADPGAVAIDEVAEQGGAASGSGETGSGLSAEDEEVLRQLEAQGTMSVGGDFITKLQFSRSDELAKETDRLLGVMSDLTNDPEEAKAAAEELDRLEEKESRMTSIEEQLQGTFPNAVVAEENDAYKVVVESEQLDRSQAASIVDMVMQTMEVGADRVSVQYIP